MRARTLKPEFFADKKIGQLGPVAALVFQALWCMADDGGVAPCEPETIKGQMFVWWPSVGLPEITEALRQLCASGRIRLHQGGDSYFAEIVSWMKHNGKIHMPSKFRNSAQHNDFRAISWEDFISPAEALRQPSPPVHLYTCTPVHPDTPSPAADAAAHEAVGLDLSRYVAVQTFDPADIRSAPRPTESAARPVARAVPAGEQVALLDAPPQTAAPAKAGKAPPKPRAEPNYPHYSREACDELYALWKERKGGMNYGRFRKETAVLFDSPTPPYTLDEVRDAMMLAIAVTKHAMKQGRPWDWNRLTPATWAGDIVRWVEDHRRKIADPDYIHVLMPSEPARRAS